jgi:hypothetical protein
VFGFYFIFLFEISIARFGIMYAVEGRSAGGMKRERERERERGRGDISTSTTKGNIIISRVFVCCFVK